MDLKERLLARADSYYYQYINVLKTEACLGTEFKMYHNSFNEKNLTAHKIAAEYLGQHKACHEILKMIEEEDSLLK